MSLLYLIRHGQAGSREEYDRLSSLGQAQARALGAWLAREGVRFDAVWSGGLRRQRETASTVLNAMAQAGQPQPEAFEDTRWNEFDLDAVYESVAPRMAAEDPVFRDQLQALRQAISSGDSQVNRTWTPSDTAVVQSWVAGRYSSEVESWAEFVARVRHAAEEPLALALSGRCVAVFTSATPVAITIGLALPLEGSDMMELAGASLNSNVTILNASPDWPRLFAFNGTAHLGSPELRTLR